MIIGCDYSTKAIDLSQHYEKGWRHAKLHVNDFDKMFLSELEYLLKTWASWAEPTEERIIYIEQPWIGMGGKQARTGNPKTSMLMIKVSTVVQIIAMQQGYRVEWAHPSSWKSAVFGKGKWPRAKAKAKSIEVASQMTTLDIGIDDNKADACCIQRFGEIREEGRTMESNHIPFWDNEDEVA